MLLDVDVTLEIGALSWLIAATLKPYPVVAPDCMARSLFLPSFSMCFRLLTDERVTRGDEHLPSIIIPAHEEETVIERTLRPLLAESIPDLEIVVVVNATTDRTAEIVRELDPRITVIETDTPGKTHALNLGEQVSKSFPRVFLDADIVLGPGTLPALLKATSESHPVVSPRLVYDVSDCTMVMRLYMWAESFDHFFGRGAPNGSGCFSLSRAGRSRWNDFPRLIADDTYVKNHFQPSESMTVADTEATVLPPRDLLSMIRVRARVRRGNYELKARHPELMGKHGTETGGVVVRMLLRPLTWPAFLIYCFVNALERPIALYQIARGETGWARDETNRVRP